MKKSLLFLIVILSLLFACQKDDPIDKEILNNEELETRAGLLYQFFDTSFVMYLADARRKYLLFNTDSIQSAEYIRANTDLARLHYKGQLRVHGVYIIKIKFKDGSNYEKTCYYPLTDLRGQIKIVANHGQGLKNYLEYHQQTSTQDTYVVSEGWRKKTLFRLLVYEKVLTDYLIIGKDTPRLF
jgi:hypothetical protein